MTTSYVRSTDGNNADDGSTWALAKADLHTPTWGAGDTIYVSDNHAQSTAASITIATGGTLASPTKIICGDDAAEPPTAVSTAGTITTTGTSSITITGVCYVHGLAFLAGSGSASGVNITQASADGNTQDYEACRFHLVNTNASAGVVVGSAGSGIESRTTWRNCDVKFAAAGQHVKVNQSKFRWSGGSLLAGGTSPTYLIELAADGGEALIEGVDFSNAAQGVNMFAGAATGSGTARIRNSKLPLSWSGSLCNATPTAFNTRFEMYNCDSSDTNYRMWIEDYAGSIKSETTIVRSGGASDGTTQVSWRMATSANAEYPVIHLESPERAIWNETTGSSVTATVEIVHDSQGAGGGGAFQDDEIWLEVQYLGTSGFPLGGFVDDAKADVLATAADQASSSESWTTTGLASPVKQKLSVTFTPQEKGVILWKLVMAKASKVAYIDPKLVLS